MIPPMTPVLNGWTIPLSKRRHKTSNQTHRSQNINFYFHFGFGPVLHRRLLRRPLRLHYTSHFRGWHVYEKTILDCGVQYRLQCTPLCHESTALSGPPSKVVVILIILVTFVVRIELYLPLWEEQRRPVLIDSQILYVQQYEIEFF